MFNILATRRVLPADLVLMQRRAKLVDHFFARLGSTPSSSFATRRNKEKFDSAETPLMTNRHAVGGAAQGA
jgi:hypothetical protein